MRQARDRMDREYAQPLDVPALARTALMSPAHFSRRFRAAYSETPYSYLMTRRIERAKALLRLGDLSVTEVCFHRGPANYRPHRSDRGTSTSLPSCCFVTTTTRSYGGFYSPWKWSETGRPFAAT